MQNKFTIRNEIVKNVISGFSAAGRYGILTTPPGKGAERRGA